MGIRGPQPKPTEIRLLEGNPSGRKINYQEPKPQRITEVEAPSHFTEAAVRVWKSLTDELARLNLLTVLDLEAVARYVDYLMEYRRARDEIKGVLVIPYFEADGKTLRYMQQNPYIAIKNTAADKLLRLEQQFGMSPAARARIIAIADGGRGGGPDEDPYGA